MVFCCRPKLQTIWFFYFDQIYESVKSTHYIVCDILGIYISLIDNLRKIRTKNPFVFRKPILPKKS